MSHTSFINATIVDGTGAPSYQGNVCIHNGQIDQISRETTPNGDEVIDLNGAVLAPGFIESHSHSDFEVFEDPFLAPKVRQGITTEMIGQDGFGAAPVSPSDANEWATRMQTFSGSADEPQMFERV